MWLGLERTCVLSHTLNCEPQRRRHTCAMQLSPSAHTAPPQRGTHGGPLGGPGIDLASHHVTKPTKLSEAGPQALSSYQRPPAPAAPALLLAPGGSAADSVVFTPWMGLKARRVTSTPARGSAWK
jgi:hypothetical protein